MRTGTLDEDQVDGPAAVSFNEAGPMRTGTPANTNVLMVGQAMLQ